MDKAKAWSVDTELYDDISNTSRTSIILDLMVLIFESFIVHPFPHTSGWGSESLSLTNTQTQLHIVHLETSS